MNVLLIEDEARIAEFIKRGLSSESWIVSHAADGETGLQLAEQGGVDVIVLDIMLPGMSGEDVCRQLRARGNTTPILMLTALDSREDRVRGLRLGADDYLSKPFDFDELMARIEALHRRATGFDDCVCPVLQCGPFRYDTDTLEVTCDGVPVDLTAKERDIFRLLIAKPGRVFSRERILNVVWGANEDPLTNVIDVYVGRLRRKLGATGDRIETVRGIGYRLRRDTPE